MRLTLIALMAGSLMVLNAQADEPSRLHPIGTYEVDEAELVYRTIEGNELRAIAYRPKRSGTLPAAIDIHGGTWSSLDRRSGRVYDTALASTGLFLLAIDFRQGPAFKHPAANEDIAEALRYLRAAASELHIDSNSIGLIGSSSGGHLALLAGLTPTSFARDDAAKTDPGVRYVIALWPVSDPAYRYEFALRVGRAELVRGHDAYFGTREAMQAASVPRLLRAGEATHQPPILVVQPGSDANIPREMTFDLLDAYQKANGHIEYAFYPDQPHAFGHRESKETTDLVVAMSHFIERQLHDSQPANRPAG